MHRVSATSDKPQTHKSGSHKDRGQKISMAILTNIVLLVAFFINVFFDLHIAYA